MFTEGESVILLSPFCTNLVLEYYEHEVQVIIHPVSPPSTHPNSV